jgi:hypothetical protein
VIASSVALPFDKKLLANDPVIIALPASDDSQ